MGLRALSRLTDRGEPAFACGDGGQAGIEGVVELSAEDLATIDDEIPAAAGDRYDPTGMATVQQ